MKKINAAGPAMQPINIPRPISRILPWRVARKADSATSSSSTGTTNTAR